MRIACGFGSSMASAIVVQLSKTREASMAKARKKASRKAAKKVQRRRPKAKAKARAKARTQESPQAQIHRQPSPRGRFRRRPAHLRQVPRSRHRAGDRRHGAGACHQFRAAVQAGRSVDAALPRRRFPDDLCAQGLDQKRVRGRRRAHLPRRLVLDPAAAGSSTPCSAIPTIARCWRSCCRRISRR